MAPRAPIEFTNAQGERVGNQVQVEAGNLNIGNVDVLTIAAGASPDIGATTDAEAAGNGSIIAILKRLRTLLGTLAGAVAGTEVQVDVVAALPAGANNIGDVDVASIAAGDNDIGNVDLVPQAGAGGHVHEPAANTAAVVTLAGPGVGVSNVVACVYWSYDDDPTAGSLTITDGGTTVLKVDITTGGPGFLPFTPPLAGGANAAVVATLAAGGAGVSGIVNLHAWTE